MDFSYIAINSKYQKVTGDITAETNEKAKEQLHKMGLSVLKMSESAGGATDAVTSSGNIHTFWFLIRDQNGQESSGTIDAADRKTAFRRLMSEYKFEVLALCEDSVPEENRLEEGKKGLTELAAEIKAEFGITEQLQKEAPRIFSIAPTSSSPRKKNEFWKKSIP